MLKITRKFDYAMVLLTDLGLHGKKPASARAIADRYGLSLSLTANVLKGLQRSAIVRSIRGVRGGYVLGREPAEISLASVILAIEGDRPMTDCQGGPGKKDCPAFTICPARSYINYIERRIRGLFADASLADVLESADPKRKGPESRTDLAAAAGGGR